MMRNLDYRNYYKSKLLSILTQKNIWYILRRIAYRMVLQPLIRIKRNQTFTFADTAYKYFYHSYNTTFINERAVEIPIFNKFIENVESAKILEIGNTMSHYRPVSWTVIDKYESTPHVTPVDCELYAPGKKYDLVFSISTMEHVGFDETPRDPNKSNRVIDRIINHLLTPGGRFIFSIPSGWNPHLEEYIATGKIKTTSWKALKRVSILNDWEQVDNPRSVIDLEYDMYSNAVHIVEIVHR